MNLLMLGLQAASLEQQRELWDTQVRLQHTEILYRELDLYVTAFTSLSTAAALLAGFAFSGLALALEESVTGLRALLAILCITSTAINLVALCAATFAAIFSVRLALRGTEGEANVEQAVRQARDEYRLVLRIFVAGIVVFFASLGVAGYLTLGPLFATIGLIISAIGLAVVFFLFARIDTRFNLKARASATLTAFHLRRAERAMPAASWFGSPVEHASSAGTGSVVATSYRPVLSEGYLDDAASQFAASECSERPWNRDDSIRGPLLDSRSRRDEAGYAPRRRDLEQQAVSGFGGAKLAAARTPAVGATGYADPRSAARRSDDLPTTPPRTAFDEMRSLTRADEHHAHGGEEAGRNNDHYCDRQSAHTSESARRQGQGPGDGAPGGCTLQ